MDDTRQKWLYHVKITVTDAKGCEVIREKDPVFREAFRVLRPGGRLMVSDIVLLRELPDIVRDSVAAYVGCISGAMIKDQYLEAMKSAGFSEAKVIDDTPLPVTDTCRTFTKQAKDARSDSLATAAQEIEGSVRSIKVFAIKPI